MVDNRFDLFILINNFAAEGCPRLALNLIENFKKRNLKIMLLTFNNENNDLLEEFKKKNISIESYNLKNNGYFRYISILYKTYILSRKYKPTAILSFPFGWHSLIAISAKLSGVRNVITHVGNPAPKNRSKNFWKFNILVQIGRIFTNKIICCSKYVGKSVMDRFYLSNSEITYIYNCFDEELFTFKEEYKIKIIKAASEKEIVLGMVARMEKHKDQESLIKALVLFKEQSFKTKLLLIGDGTQRVELEKLTNNLNLTNQVIFLGAINNVSKKLDEIDIFVFSTTEEEGFGIALAEAMGKGVPIIASNVEACSEILLHGKCGLLFDPKSPHSIYKAVDKVLNNQEDTFKRVSAAYYHALNNFTKKKMANLYFQQLFKNKI